MPLLLSWPRHSRLLSRAVERGGPGGFVGLRGGSVRLKRLMRHMCGSVRYKRPMRHKPPCVPGQFGARSESLGKKVRDKRDKRGKSPFAFNFRAAFDA